MAIHQKSPILQIGIISLILGIASSASVSSRLQPSPSAMSTPYRNDHPVIYMTAFYDPKYHSSSLMGVDGGRGSKTLPTSATAKTKQSTPTARTFTREEKVAILQKYQMLQNAKFKRGIANSVDFTGVGDSLAVETRDSLAMESEGTPRIVVKAKLTPTPSPASGIHSKKQKNKDQIQSESGKKVKTIETPNSGYNPNQPQSYYDNHGGHNQPISKVVGGYISQAREELTHGRRKMRAHYFRQSKTPSLGKAFVEVKSRIGYW